MANVKITDLAALTNPASTDVLPIVDVGADVTKKISIADLLENAGSGTASAPGIAFDGDSNTGIYRPGADQVAISTNGTGRLFVDANGRVGVGTSAARAVGGNVAGNFYIEDNSVTHAVIINNEDNIAGPSLRLGKTRGTTSGSTTVVQNGDDLGSIQFAGADGTDLVSRGASIAAQVDGTPGANDMPGRLVFSTTADGASSPTEQLRITSDRYVRLASGTGGIQFNGDTAAANALDDYEEGTWTPNITFATPGDLSVTYAQILGRYTKIGDTVIVHFRVVTSTFTHTTAVGALRITGLPFAASASNPSFQGSAFSGFQGITNANYTQYSVIIENGQTHLIGAKQGSGQPAANILPADTPTGGTLIFHGCVTYKA